MGTDERKILKEFDQVGRLILLQKFLLPSGAEGVRLSHWYCICSCGNTKLILQGNLKSARPTSSCGCFHIDQVKRKYPKEETVSPLFKRWEGMKCRTQNNNLSRARTYKNRNIGFCKEWENYYNFKNWALDNGFHPSLTLDRINNDKGYEPSNCRWVTLQDNLKNRRYLLDIGIKMAPRGKYRRRNIEIKSRLK